MLAVAVIPVLIALVAGVFFWVASRHRWFRTFRYFLHRSTDAVVADNIVVDSNHVIQMLNDGCRRELFSHVALLEQWENALRRGVHVDVAFGPDIDLTSSKFLGMLAAYPDQTRVFLFPPSVRDDLYDAEHDRYRYQHFTIGDGKHLCLECPHGVSTPISEVSWEEFHNSLRHASPWRQLFESLVVNLSVQVLSTNIVAGAVENELTFIEYGEGKPRPATDREVERCREDVEDSRLAYSKRRRGANSTAAAA